jgi:HEAT repeat protein
VPALTGLLGDKNPQVRREAILALAEIGEASAPAVPQLVKALADEVDRTPATFALGRIGKPAGDADAAIRANLKDNVKLVEMDCHVNDPQFAERICAEFRAIAHVERADMVGTL